MNSREIEQAVVDNQNLVRFAINRYFPGLRDDEDMPGEQVVFNEH